MAPTFSVIVPTYERPDELRRCLEGFARVEFRSWELLVVNDGGPRSFTGLDDDLRARLPLRLLEVPHGGPAAARNAGAREGTGDFLAFTDDDCVPAPDWIEALERGFAETGADVLGGECLNPYPSNVPAVTWQLYLEFLRQHSRDRAGNDLMLPSNNVAYRSEVFWSVGGFDASFPTAAGEDVDLAYRVVERGYRQLHLESARVWHHHRNTIRGYVSQQLRYGRGTSDLLRRRYAVSVPRLPRWKFHAKLGRFLRERRAPWGVFLLAFLTPLIHRAGIEASRIGRR
jgi:GT2 family glycosyltransferase